MDFQNWKRKAKSSQQELAEQLGDRVWDEFKLLDDKQLLWEKIAYAVLGCPRDATSNERGYSKDEEKTISELTNKCLKKKIDEKVYIAFIFVMAYKSGSGNSSIPLIRLRKRNADETRNSYFIDHCGRVYKNWQSFLNDNIFNGYWICVPKDGLYFINEDTCCIEFIDQREKGKILEKLDEFAKISSITSSLGMVAGLTMSFFPPTALIGATIVAASTIVGAPASVYGTGRSVGTLVNRGQHDQTLSLTNPEARACWISRASSALSLGIMGSTKLLTSAVKAGRVASSGTKALFTALGMTNLSVSGIGIFNSFAELSQKDKVTPLDIFQLTTSVFFFTHSFVSFQTARSIIEKTQDQVIAQKKQDLSKENKGNFDVSLDARKKRVSPGKSKKIHGNVEFTRSIKKIQDINEFYNTLCVRLPELFIIPNEPIVDQKAYLYVNNFQIKTIADLSNQLRSGDINKLAFDTGLAAIRQEYYNLPQRANATSDMFQSFGKSKTVTPRNHYKNQNCLPKVDPNNNFPPERYTEIATELIGLEVVEEMKWTQDGHFLVLHCISIDCKSSVQTIYYDNLADKKSVIATVKSSDGTQINRLYEN